MYSEGVIGGRKERKGKGEVEKRLGSLLDVVAVDSGDHNVALIVHEKYRTQHGGEGTRYEKGLVKKKFLNQKDFFLELFSENCVLHRHSRRDLALLI